MMCRMNTRSRNMSKMIYKPNLGFITVTIDRGTLFARATMIYHTGGTAVRVTRTTYPNGRRDTSGRYEYNGVKFTMFGRSLLDLIVRVHLHLLWLRDGYEADWDGNLFTHEIVQHMYGDLSFIVRYNQELE